MKVTKGMVLAVTQGEYSDYYLKAHLRVLKDFDTEEVIAQYKQENPKPDDGWLDGSWDQDEFLAWCQKQELTEDVPEAEVQEWHIGSHGDLV